jgi:hypothetical protein
MLASNSLQKMAGEPAFVLKRLRVQSERNEISFCSNDNCSIPTSQPSRAAKSCSAALGIVAILLNTNGNALVRFPRVKIGKYLLCLPPPA